MVLMSLQIQVDCRMPTGYCQAKGVPARKGIGCHVSPDQGWSPGAVYPKEESVGGKGEG